MDDTLHFRSLKVRVKILKDSAKGLATVSLGYIRGDNSIEAVSGRTIHAGRIHYSAERQAGGPDDREAGCRPRFAR